MKKVLAFAFSGALACFGWGCGDDATADDSPIKIGVALALTGPLASPAQLFSQGAQIWSRARSTPLADSCKAAASRLLLRIRCLIPTWHVM